VSRPQRPSRPRRPPARPAASAPNRPRSPLGRSSRAQIAFVLLSALVICSIILAAVATISFDGLFGDSNDPTDAAENYKDPNADIIGEQQTIVAEHPDDFASLALLANLLSNTGRLKEAIPIYEKALSIRPDDVGTRLDFARALGDGNLRADAEAQYKTILTQDPENQQAHYYLAELYRNWVPMRKDEAISEYQKVVELDSSTYIAQQSRDQLVSLGAATPNASPDAFSSPATAEATP
jgi:cytochrome c-type biogenesis protein CcmH/NrfG